MTAATGARRITLRGVGASPRKEDLVKVNYEGRLLSGFVFDSSYERGAPMEIPFGKGMVIPGWEEGLSTMHAGGKRTLVIPAPLGYGDQGSGTAIPPGATLRFEIELIDVKDAAPPMP